MSADPTTETITLIQPILGMEPYILIVADKDPADDELVLRINAGGGAAEEIGVLPFMLISQLPADKNPITQGIADLLDDHPGDAEAMVRLTEYLGIPMPGSWGDGIDG